MCKSFKWYLVSVCCLGILGGIAQAQDEDLVALQPKLLVGDVPLDARVSMQLRIYSSMTSGQLLFEDSNTVTVADGMYSTVLGDDPTLGSITSAIAGDRAYLEIVIDGTPLPRRPIASDTLRSARRKAVRGEPVEIGVASVVSRQVDIRASRGLRAPFAAAPEPSIDLARTGGGDPAANVVASGVTGAAIGGGGTPSEPNRVNRNFGTIAGGSGNRVDGSFASVGGGIANRAAGTRSVVGGGRANLSSGVSSTVSGGFTNTVTGDYASIGGGWKNLAQGYVATVGGGWENAATGLVSSVAGGQYNSALGSASSVGGGWKNHATGAASTVPGGRNNTAAGEYSLAAGRKAEALHPGTFVWSDSSEETTASTGPDQFLIRAAGNVGIDVASPTEKLTVAGNIAPDPGGEHRLGSEQRPWAALHLTGDIAYDRTLEVTHQGRTNLVVDPAGNLGLPGTVTAAAFVGDGSQLTGIPGRDQVDSDALTQRFTDLDVLSQAVASSSNSLTLKAGEHPVLRIDASGKSPAIVMGEPTNSLTPGSAGATISGGGSEGSPNTADGEFAVVSGGMGNQVVGPYGTISGGFDNRAHNSGSTVGGGIQNVVSNWNATVGGGRANVATGLGSSVGGGRGNIATNRYVAIPGGYFNTASGAGAAVGGGFANTASGFIATVPGGSQNEAAGDYSLAAGRRARAQHHGSFVWADSIDQEFTSSSSNQVLFRATGGVGIGTINTPEQLTVDGNIAPAVDQAGSLGADQLRWKTLHLATGIRAADGLVIQGEGKTLATFDPDGNLIIPGSIHAGSILGDGSGLTGIVARAIAAGSISPRDIDLEALDQIYQRKGSEPDSTAFSIADGSVGSPAIADGSIAPRDVDLEAFDRRYVQPQDLPAPVQMPTETLDFAAGLAGVIDIDPDQGQVSGSFRGDGSGLTGVVASAVTEGSISPRDIDLEAFDQRYVKIGEETPESDPSATLNVQGPLLIQSGNPGEGKVLMSDADGLARWEALPPPTVVQTTTAQDFQFAPVFGPKAEQPLILQVGGRRALRIEPGTQSPNLIGGSDANTVPPRTDGATIAGGGTREQPNQVNGIFGTIGGGSANVIKGPYAVVSGGWQNQAEGPRSSVGGGRENLAEGVASVIGGGFTNTAAGSYATVGGGWGNRALGYVSTLAGGWGNAATGMVSSIGGGQENRALGSGSTISGGWKNEATGLGATVPGGKENIAAGDFSVAMGLAAQALHAGSFVWNDATESPFASTEAGQFLIRASGNVGIDIDHPTEKLTVAGAVRADRFIGDGSQLTGLPSALPHPGSITRDHLAPDLRDALDAPPVTVTPSAPDLTNLTDLSLHGTLAAQRLVGDGSRITGIPFSSVAVPSNAVHGELIAPESIHLDHLSAGVANLLQRDIPDLDALTDLTLRGTIKARRVAGDGSGLTHLRFDHIQIPDGGISAEKIMLGSITREHLAEGVWPGEDNDDPPTHQAQSSAGAPSLIGGHSSNRVAAGAIGSVIAGGGDAGAPNLADQSHAVIGGGMGNTAGNEFATIGGGFGNLADGFDSTIAGGQDNRSEGSGAFVGGGYTNRAVGSFSAIPGGAANQAEGNVSVVGGGFGNQASGSHSVVPGGALNVAAGDYSLAAGRRAKALHAGSLVWADSTDTDLRSERSNQFLVRASGGTLIASDPGLQSGVALNPGSGSWSMLSDRSSKENFAVADPRAILDTLVTLPLWTWNYRAQAEEIRHLGPVAQDFRSAFGLGENDTHISAVDIQGVALTAIQGLHDVVQEKARRIDELEHANQQLATRLGELEQRLQQLQERSFDSP